MSETRQPPDPAIAAAYIGGAFVGLAGLIFGFYMLARIIDDASAPSYAPPPHIARNDAPAPPPYTPPQAYVPPQPYVPPRPVMPPQHLSFADIDEALKYLPSSQPMEARAAADYLARAPLDSVSHDKMLTAARVMIGNESQRTAGINILKTWAQKTDADLLREILTAMLQSGAASSPTGVGAVKTMIELVSGFGDKDAGPLYVQCMQTQALRDRAGQALVDLGPAAEELIAPLAAGDDRDIALRALKILAQVGTEKSVMAFHRAIYLKTPEIATAAETSLKDLGTRLNLKPEQYLYVVLDRYALTPPASFTADAAYTHANSRQWTRKAPNRSVNSVFTITVKIVPQNYAVPAVQGTEIDVGTLKFLPVEQPVSNNITQTVHFAAVDDEYLIDIKATLDLRDPPAQGSITTAVNSIHAQ